MRVVRLLGMMVFSLALFGCAGVDRAPGLGYAPLQISPEGRYFQRRGQPFVWIGATAWRATRRLDEAGITAYLSDRAERGFNVVQGPNWNVGWLHHHDIYPVAPLRARTLPVDLNEAYFARLDAFIRTASELDFIVVLPFIWGPNTDEALPSIRFARAYAAAVAKRYQDYANIVWLAVGEYHKTAWSPSGVDSSDAQTYWDMDRLRLTQTEIDWIRAFALGLREQAHPKSLITLHPYPNMSPLEHFAAAPWLDFTLLQGGGYGDYNLPTIRSDYAASPVRPVVNGETLYEGKVWRQRPYIASDVRRSAYHSWLNGVAGVTYGHDTVWRFAQGWRQALNAPGAVQIATHFRRFVEQIHDESNRPSPEIVVEDAVRGVGVVSAMMSGDRRRAWVYVGNGHPFGVRMEHLAQGPSVRARWFNPRIGQFSEWSTQRRMPLVTFDPPGEISEDNDWLLELSVDP